MIIILLGTFNSFLVISSAPAILKEDKIFFYAPFTQELNIWANHNDKLTIACPIGWPYPIPLGRFHSKAELIRLHTINWNTSVNVVKSFLKLPFLFNKLYSICKSADHIHLRCPGNIGLLGCIVQICFPKTPKTVKYAGNWDPQAKQPLSYRLQKWILSNTFLSKNIKVLVYGQWPNQSKNIMPFFTASYSEKHCITAVPVRDWSQPLRFVFVGTLSEGKRPMYALELFQSLLDKLNRPMSLEFFGTGPQDKNLKKYVTEHGLKDRVKLLGNIKSDDLIEVYKSAHILILPSRSEGWPKAVAEAMFWGAIPLVTPISCVPWMIDQGKRGITLDLNLKSDCLRIEEALSNPNTLDKMSQEAAHWSRQYTTEKFTKAIKELF